MKPSAVLLLSYGLLVLIFAGVSVGYFVPTRETTRRESCAWNLKQLSLAALMYAQDYHEYFPLKPRSGGDWTVWHFNARTWDERAGPLAPYMEDGRLDLCPSDRTDTRSFNANPRSSYVWNDALCGKLVDDCTGQPLIWDREPWHRHQRNVSYATKTGNSVVRLVP